MTLQDYPTGLERSPGSWSPLSCSESSSSTLALEDDEAIDIVATDKLTTTFSPPDSSKITSGLSSLNTPTDATELNPYAIPFLPLPHLPVPPKSRCLLRPIPNQMLQPRIPRWLRSFQRATNSPSSDTPAKELALIVINAEAWDPEKMTEIAQEICWKAAEASPEDLEATITFSTMLHLRFRQLMGQHFADSFLWHLKETLLGTFMSVWNAVSLQSLRRFP